MAGARTDHESTTAAEAEEKLRLGMWLLVREGSTKRNLRDLLPVVKRLLPSRSAFCSDDITANHLLRVGHLDAVLRQAVAGGLDAMQAVRMATINAAQCFGLHRRGAIAPGFQADIVVVDTMDRFNALHVFKRGKLVASDGELVEPIGAPVLDEGMDTMRVPPLTVDSFTLPGKHGVVRAIGIIPDQIVTDHLMVPAPFRDDQPACRSGSRHRQDRGNRASRRRRAYWAWTGAWLRIPSRRPCVVRGARRAQPDRGGHER